MKRLKQIPFRALAVTAAVCFAATLQGQSLYHVDVDYHYNLGLSEKFMGTRLSPNDYEMGGHSLRLTVRYDFAPRWSAGLGAGLDRYTDPDYNTLPVFATVRYSVLPCLPQAYAYADLGYAVKAGDYNKGLMGGIGIGYTHMFARHFGLNFQVGYQLKRFEDIPLVVYFPDSGETSYSEKSSTRHSLSLGIGVTF